MRWLFLERHFDEAVGSLGLLPPFAACRDRQPADLQGVEQSHTRLPSPTRAVPRMLATAPRCQTKPRLGDSTPPFVPGGRVQIVNRDSGQTCSQEYCWICCVKKTPCTTCEKLPSRKRVVAATAKLKLMEESMRNGAAPSSAVLDAALAFPSRDSRKVSRTPRAVRAVGTRSRPMPRRRTALPFVQSHSIRPIAFLDRFLQ